MYLSCKLWQFLWWFRRIMIMHLIAFTIYLYILLHEIDRSNIIESCLLEACQFKNHRDTLVFDKNHNAITAYQSYFNISMSWNCLPVCLCYPMCSRFLQSLSHSVIDSFVHKCHCKCTTWQNMAFPETVPIRTLPFRYAATQLWDRWWPLSAKTSSMYISSPSLSLSRNTWNSK